ncbi:MULTISPECIES: acyl-CoA carboxylase epsilon subunit [unclassified Streptomyces]|uniref:acyl-CoA carboxylase epsilon subunit n=1 Tax=unclassified Streptomyces TaxID=2593676 RepID=UPI002DD803BA|nr:acyl-CoA carboxylase epsilon subunit [Streptomyces sp. NBC_01750]WSB05387.1 acyl-CoA carboxylase subunit epsilon [Streptomyces sp. NBC_01794]WSD37886.1 acyl-CoA carboxylase subunit epsilon [Streptomyces sp. NBC_01750]
MIKVVRGNPTPEELAAALAVVQARAAATASVADGEPLLPEQWSDPARIGRSRRPQPGPRAWARTYWPV